MSFIGSTGGAFRAAVTAGVVALTVAGAALATTQPAEAFVRHGGVHHGGGLGHRFAYGHGRWIGGFGVRHRAFGHHPYGFGRRVFAYGVGMPFGGYGFRHCPIGRHLVPGLGCRLDRVYGGQVFGFRSFGYRMHRVIHVRGFHGHHRGGAFHRHGFGHPFGDHHHGGRFHHHGHVHHH